ncbi:hypothetical protein NESM_000267400 [Novymonas esmeraldas]|uniref:Uncharacterized protein n=1 Tax=Novymonas esmeraldas TaxID=1808958 RepID=A0AAW0F8V2_9TRYP
MEALADTARALMSEALRTPTRGAVMAGMSLDRFNDSLPPYAAHMLALSGDSDATSRVAGGQSYPETINVDPTLSGSHSSTRMEAPAPAAAAAVPSAMPSVEELLDEPAGPRRSTTMIPVRSPTIEALIPVQKDTDSAEAAVGQPPSRAAASTEVAAATAASSAASRSPAPSCPPTPPITVSRPADGASTSALGTPSADTLAAAAAADAATLRAPVPHLSSSEQGHVSATATPRVAVAEDNTEHSPTAKPPAASRHASPRTAAGARSRSAVRAGRAVSTSRRRSATSASPSRRVGRTRGPTSSVYIAALLRGILGTATPADKAAVAAAASAGKTRGAVSTAPPPVSRLDLPVGLLVLYCAAEEACAVVEGATHASAAGAGVAATVAAAATAAAGYSMLYILEQLSDLRRRDHRAAALQRASEVERVKCEQLYVAAARRRAFAAAQEATHALAVEEEELGACTFHPAVSETAQRVEGKGTKDFMQKCVAWRAEADRRLQHKYERFAEVEAEQQAAAAALDGTLVPGEAMTAESRRLLEQPGVQARLKARPCLWEAKRPAEESPGGVVAPTAAELIGAPVTSAMRVEQEAVLHLLRLPATSVDASADASQLPPNTSASRAPKSGAVSMKEFLSRVEHDAQRREQQSARLQARYHNPAVEQFIPATGQPLFRPNAMPTTWKEGRRVGYDDLSKEEQDAFRAELRRTGHEYVLTHYLREQQRERRRSAMSSVRAADTPPPPPQDGEADTTLTSVEGAAQSASPSSGAPARAVSVSAQSRFMASLEAAVARHAQSRERALAQATVEETFRPQLTKRSVKMALHKTGGTPIYKRPLPSREEAAAEPLSSSFSPSPRHKDRALPEAAELFLARNGQWSEARQQRLQRLAGLEEERQLSGCTFNPNRDFGGAHEATAVPPPGGAEGTPAGGTPRAMGGDAASTRHASSQLHARPQDVLASAADVRVMNELELLRTGAAYRDGRFVQAVCDNSGTSDVRRAMANLSLHSAPRLTGSDSGAWVTSPSQPRHTASSALHTHLSPIQQRSHQPSSSPYLAPRRSTRAPSFPFHETPPVSAPRRSMSDSTQTPMHRPAAGEVAAARHHPLRAGASASSSPSVDDPWAALDAQTDAVLRRCGF